MPAAGLGLGRVDWRGEERRGGGSGGVTGVDLARRRIGRASAWGTDVGAEDVGEDDGGEEAELLGHGVDERPQRGDVGAQGLAGDEHELLGEGDADAAGVVLLLRHAAEALVVRAAVGAHGVDELVLGPGAVGAAVGEEDGGAADAEERVGHQHRPVVAHVGVEGDVLRAHHQRVRVRVHLQCQFDFNLISGVQKQYTCMNYYLPIFIIVAEKLKFYLIIFFITL